jgi:GTP-binding protein
VNISSAIFDCSSPDLDSCPDESLPEFAFIGRSNVGKSSLLNMLLDKPGLAKVSPTPGHTKMINMFTVNRTWRLVDLPGYGYAQVARADKSQFNRAVNDYLEHRPNLFCVFALIDSGLPAQQIDVDFVQWLTDKSLPFVLVFTKLDKVSAKEAETNIASFTKRISTWFEQLPTIFTSSATTGKGREELLKVIGEELAAIKARPVSTEAAPVTGPKLGAPSNRKKRPDQNRPW